jgi:VWFA-related protein
MAPVDRFSRWYYGTVSVVTEKGHAMSSIHWWKSRLVAGRPGLLWWLPLVVVLFAMALPMTGTAQQPPDTQTPGTPQRPEASETPPEQPPGEPDAQVDPDEPDTAEQPVFRSEINFVRVDAIVTDDDDNLVLDLTADDFEIFEDDTLQEIESFELIEITGEPDPSLPPPSSIRNEYDEERESARTDSRIFVFFLDDYHVRDTNAMRMTAPLVEFVQTQLAPTDLVAVMYPLTPLFDVQLTRNHEQVVRALQAFEGRKYNYDPRNSYEAQYAYYPTTEVEKIRNDVSLSGLKALAIHLGGLREGRKSIIVLTEGYSNYVPPQLRNESAAGGGQRSYARYDPFAGAARGEESSQFFDDAAMRLTLMWTADVANKSNTSLYMVDPRGLAVYEYDMSTVPIGTETDGRVLRALQDTLYVLAEETDGRAIVNRNDVLPGLAQIVRDQSAYYLLGYTSSGAYTDGEFHEIKVRVSRPDVQIRARKGYYALTEENAARVLAPPKPALPKAVDIALATLAEPIRGRLVRTWVGTRRGDNGKTDVTFVWEPVGNNQSQRNESASQVMLMAMNDTDAYFRGQVPSRDDETPRVDFEADPGALELNAAIEDEYGDVIDRAVNEITIPDFTGTDVAMSTPAVFRAQNAMEMRRLVDDRDALPTATRYFRRTESLLVRVEAYTPGNAPVEVTAQLLSREGTSMRALPVEPPSADGPHQLTLQLAPFPRGDYLIEISAASGDDVVTTLVAFRIQG